MWEVCCKQVGLFRTSKELHKPLPEEQDKLRLAFDLFTKLTSGGK
jgi:hypothetical protein